MVLAITWIALAFVSLWSLYLCVERLQFVSQFKKSSAATLGYFTESLSSGDVEFKRHGSARCWLSRVALGVQEKRQLLDALDHYYRSLAFASRYMAVLAPLNMKVGLFGTVISMVLMNNDGQDISSIIALGFGSTAVALVPAVFVVMVAPFIDRRLEELEFQFEHVQEKLFASGSKATTLEEAQNPAPQAIDDQSDLTLQGAVNRIGSIASAATTELICLNVANSQLDSFETIACDAVMSEPSRMEG